MGLTIANLAKTAIVFGIFYIAIKTIEQWNDLTPDASNHIYTAIDSPDDDNPNTFTPVIINAEKTETTKVIEEIFSKPEEEMISESEEENDDEFHHFVIGAEDRVDHINRMIGY